MSIALIWAQARDAAGRPVIGAADNIPWHVPEDFARFRELTSEHPVVMGRRTWDSLPRRPLPGRTNIVMTRQRGWHAVGAVTAHSLDQALGIAELAPGGDQVWVIGGGDLYQQALPRTERVEITEIDTVVDGDTFAPALDPSVWLCTSSHAAEWLTSTGPQALRYRFDTLTRH